MLWLLVTLLILAGMLIPVCVTADVHHGARRLMRLHIATAIWQREWVAEALHGPEGLQLLIRRKGDAPRTVSADTLSGSPADKLLPLLRVSRPARRFLIRHTHAERLDMQLLLHTSSAASTALLTGALQTTLLLLPPQWRRISRIRVTPDFLRDRSTLQARCIFRLCVGTLFITAGLLLAEHVAQAINREA